MKVSLFVSMSVKTWDYATLIALLMAKLLPNSYPYSNTWLCFIKATCVILCQLCEGLPESKGRLTS